MYKRQDLETLLGGAQAHLALEWQPVGAPPDGRILELINKTNQFNVNGRRYGEAEWRQYAGEAGTGVLMARYWDKFGELGKIGALSGRLDGAVFRIDTWVLSCRAFSRRIEHHMLKEVFERWQVDEVMVEFQPTERNGPAGELFASLLDGPPPAGPFALTRARFLARCPALYHARPV